MDSLNSKGIDDALKNNMPLSKVQGDNAVEFADENLSQITENDLLKRYEFNSSISLSSEAYQGVLGEVVKKIEPHTEADPVGVLISMLIMYGNVIGRGPHFMADGSRHGTNIFAVLVGSTGNGKKGTAQSQAENFVRQSSPEWAKNNIHTGLSSGEGLIWAVRDRSDEDEGIEDKRLFVEEPEFANVLKQTKKDTNTLSPVVRNAFDGKKLATMTKKNPAVATNPHISLIGHITQDELETLLKDVEIANGFANRFLWINVNRSKYLPFGNSISDVDFSLDLQAIQHSLSHANNPREFKRDSPANRLWGELYGAMCEEQPGLYGSLVVRAAPIIMRIAMIYAVLDQSIEIRVEHLKAAFAIWEYNEASCKVIFGDSTGNKDVDLLLKEIKVRPNGMTRNEIKNFYGRNKKTEEIERILGFLVKYKLAKPSIERNGGRGRPTERWKTLN